MYASKIILINNLRSKTMTTLMKNRTKFKPETCQVHGDFTIYQYSEKSQHISNCLIAKKTGGKRVYNAKLTD